MDKNVVRGDYESIESFDECAQPCYGCWGFDAVLVGL